MTKIPRGLYGPNRDGLLDPARLSSKERQTRPADLLAEEYARRTSPSPFVRRLQSAADRALGRKR
ncbi:MAG: hypothetical protein VX494_10070 [Actinomycetota bacterium]|nr:hypothetical protein [Actinomycetota bacterium]